MSCEELRVTATDSRDRTLTLPISCPLNVRLHSETHRSGKNSIKWWRAQVKTFLALTVEPKCWVSGKQSTAGTLANLTTVKRSRVRDGTGRTMADRWNMNTARGHWHTDGEKKTAKGQNRDTLRRIDIQRDRQTRTEKDRRRYRQIQSDGRQRKMDKCRETDRHIWTNTQNDIQTVKETDKWSLGLCRQMQLRSSCPNTKLPIDRQEILKFKNIYRFVRATRAKNAYCSKKCFVWSLWQIFSCDVLMVLKKFRLNKFVGPIFRSL